MPDIESGTSYSPKSAIAAKEKNTNSTPATSIKPFEFTGRASEFFSIWVVNVVLTVVTLGFYGPWAKVRTNQYFYANTLLDSASFQYLANPKQILKGRMVALVIFMVYYAAGMMETTLSLVITLLLLLLLPFFLVNAMSFQLRNSAYRHVRFAFNKDYKQAYRVFILPMLLVGAFSVGNILLMPESLKQLDQEVEISQDQELEVLENEEAIFYENSPELNDVDGEMDQNEYAEEMIEEEEYQMPMDMKIYLGIQALFMILMALLYPYFDYLFSRYRSTHAQYGAKPFDFTASAGGFFRIYYIGILVLLIAMGLFGITAVVIAPQIKDLLPESADLELIKNTVIYGSLAIFAALYFWFFAYFQAKRTSLIYSNLKLRGHQLKCEMKVSYLLYLYLTNTLAMAFTLGLLMPWAKIRTARYRASVTCLNAEGDLGKFAAAQQKEQSALAEELGNMFDMDLSL